VLAVQGDGTDSAVLRDVGAPDADLFIASTDIDETNIVACGTVKALGDPFTIARVKRPQFLDTWEQQDGVFGVEVPNDSPIADRTVAEGDTFETLTFAAVIREWEVILPSGQTVIGPGDDVVVIGTGDAVERFATDIAPSGRGATEIVILGGSEIGYRTARLLERRGFKSRLVERDPDRARWLAEQLPKTSVLEHDVTDRGFLEREHIGRADVVVGAITRDGTFVTPRGETVIRTGDHVVLFTEASIIDSVLDLF